MARHHQSKFEDLIHPASNCSMPVVKFTKTNYEKWSRNLRMTFRLRGTLVAAVATGELLHPDEVPMPDPFLLQNEQFVQPVGVVPAPVQPVAVLNPAMVDNAEDGELVAEEDGNAPVVVRGDVPPPQQVMAPIVAHQPLVVKGKQGQFDHV